MPPLTCRIAFAYFLSHWACGYVQFWLDAEELLWVCDFQLQLTWSVSWVSRMPVGSLPVGLCIVHVFVLTVTVVAN